MLLVQSFTACMPLLMVTSAFGLSRRCWISPTVLSTLLLCLVTKILWIMLLLPLNSNRSHVYFGLRPRGRPKRTWKQVVQEDCQARKLNKEDAMDRCKWRRVIKEVRWSGWVWAGECFFWYRPTRVVPDKRPLNGCCCCCLLRFLFN